uniref:Uncharacterized protein n=1 Tax=Pediastrum angulosum TaxID=271408 RepID=A0A2U8GHN2_9CHLO|nr:hypothetical protein [Pediastrum angulosum]AWI68176.1 hypothetical protein [Pediastrum angulosum]
MRQSSKFFFFLRFGEADATIFEVIWVREASQRFPTIFDSKKNALARSAKPKKSDNLRSFSLRHSRVRQSSIPKQKERACAFFGNQRLPTIFDSERRKRRRKCLRIGFA